MAFDRDLDFQFMQMTKQVSRLSKDPSTKVGSIAVLNYDVVASGFNRFPDSLPLDLHDYENREYKYAHIVHAEDIVLSNLSMIADKVTMYVSHPSCERCAIRMIASHRISAVVFPKFDSLDPSFTIRWGDSCKRAIEMFRSNNIVVRQT